MPTRAIPSLVKWTGSKRSQAHRIWSLIPDHGRYFEPFLGGGALLYLAGRPGAVAGDIYGPLMSLWLMVRDRPHRLAAGYRQRWHSLRREGASFYYRVRDRFNSNPNAVDLCFLIRTCVNGIVRFNERGAFNNSYHLSRPGMHPDRFSTAVMAWHARLDGVEFRCADVRETIRDAERGDFVYLDPPYAANRQRYDAVIDTSEVIDLLVDLNRRGVRWALSYDGKRGGHDIGETMPRTLYRRHLYLDCGHSAVHRVLNGPLARVEESLYLSY